MKKQLLLAIIALGTLNNVSAMQQEKDKDTIIIDKANDEVYKKLLNQGRNSSALEKSEVWMNTWLESNGIKWNWDNDKAQEIRDDQCEKKKNDILQWRENQKLYQDMVSANYNALKKENIKIVEKEKIEKDLEKLLLEKVNNSFEHEKNLLKEDLNKADAGIAAEQKNLGWFWSFFYSTPQMQAWTAYRNELQQGMYDLDTKASFRDSAFARSQLNRRDFDFLQERTRMARE